MTAADRDRQVFKEVVRSENTKEDLSVTISGGHVLALLLFPFYSSISFRLLWVFLLIVTDKSSRKS
jgi:hypothetical protein